MEKTEDMMWVARCALLDDRKAFASLVDKYQGRVKRFFLSLTGGDESLSDDLAQETFIKVYYHLRSYKGLSSFSTWLFRVAYNLYYDELRKRGDRYFEPLDEAATIPQSPEPVDRRLDMSSVDTASRGTYGRYPLLRRGYGHRPHRRGDGYARGDHQVVPLAGQTKIRRIFKEKRI